MTRTTAAPMFMVTGMEYAVMAPDGLHMFPILDGDLVGNPRILGDDDHGCSPADVLPDEWGRCENQCGDGSVPVEELTRCGNGYRCDECGPCRHAECHYRD